MSPGAVLYQAGAGKVTVFTPGCTQVHTGYFKSLAGYSVHMKATWGRFWKATKKTLNLPEREFIGLPLTHESTCYKKSSVDYQTSHITYGFVNLTKY